MIFKTHKWDLEVDKDISIELTCNPDGTENTQNKYRLKFEFDVDGDRMAELLKRGETNVNADVEFKAVKSWDELKPFVEGNGDVTLKVTRTRDQWKLAVELERGNDRGKTQKFTCETEDLIKFGNESGSGVIFNGLMAPLGNTTLKDDRGGGLKLVVMLLNCNFGQGEKQPECDLKVTTANSLRN